MKETDETPSQLVIAPECFSKLCTKIRQWHGKIKSGNKSIQAFPVEITVKKSKMKITKAPKGWAARFPRLQR